MRPCIGNRAVTVEFLRAGAFQEVDEIRITDRDAHRAGPFLDRFCPDRNVGQLSPVPGIRVVAPELGGVVALGGIDLPADLSQRRALLDTLLPTRGTYSRNGLQRRPLIARGIIPVELPTFVALEAIQRTVMRH